MTDLAALRAEVERLRDEMLTQARESALPMGSLIGATCYGAVLDLIDKHTREGQ